MAQQGKSYYDKSKDQWIDNVEEKEEVDNTPASSYDFDWNWDEKNEKIVLTCKDKVSKRRWELIIGTESYAYPSAEYDKMNEVFDDDDYELVTHYDKTDGVLTIKFVEKYEIHKYKFHLPQIK